MKPIKIVLILAIMSGILNPVHAQKEPIKLGKIDEGNLKKESFEIDPEAEAIIIADYGRSWFEYSNTKENFQYRFMRTTRIKILKKDGYDWADAQVDFYEGSGGTKESVMGIKGFTYNLENGKVVKSKLGKESIFEEKLSENWNRIKFTMPDVKVGSIIEYTYSITSEYKAEFRSWNFQHSIPVLWSEYRATIPEYFKYQQIQQGYAGFKTEKDKKQEQFSVSYTTSPGEGGKTEKRTYTMDSYSDKYRWYASDLPALKEEPYITSLDNYYSRLEFMLSFIKYPNSTVQNYMGDYQTFNKTLLESSSFGNQFKNGGFLKDELASIKGKYSDSGEQVIAIYNHIRNHMSWNGNYGKYSTSNLRSAYKDGKGSSSDINLLLTLMLKEAGFNADPVVLSTRNAYKMHPVYPISSKINYVITQVIVGENKIMMDATDKGRPFYLLPERVLSGRGWAVSETNPGWVQIGNQEKMTTKTVVKLKIEDDLLLGEVEQIEESLTAFSSIKSYNESKEDYEKYYTESADWTVSNLHISQNKDKQLNLSHKFDIEYVEDVAGSNIIYVNPVIYTELTENPFKLEKREFPVEYPCPENNVYLLNFEIPEGYLVDELPENALVNLPDNAGQFRYITAQNGNTLSVTIQQKVIRQLFSQQEYPNLREFYNIIAAKCSEQIVLKRKS